MSNCDTWPLLALPPELPLRRSAGRPWCPAAIAQLLALLEPGAKDHQARDLARRQVRCSGSGPRCRVGRGRPRGARVPASWSARGSREELPQRRHQPRGARTRAHEAVGPRLTGRRPTDHHPLSRSGLHPLRHRRVPHGQHPPSPRMSRRAVGGIAGWRRGRLCPPSPGQMGSSYVACSDCRRPPRTQLHAGRGCWRPPWHTQRVTQLMILVQGLRGS
jgi:hypothetical protein